MHDQVTQEWQAPKPIVKWVGGKRKLVPQIKELMPAQYDSYFEPFIGGGALFFALEPKRAFLTDTNEALINVYSRVRDDVHGVIRLLKKHKYEREYYNKVRSRNFDVGTTNQMAADFIYCNKTGFNGLYRVNQSGQFNVPFGKYDNPTICDEDGLRAASRALQNAQLDTTSFQHVLDKAGKGSFCYMDPPYAPLSKTSSFVGFTKDGFGDEDQTRLRDVALALKKRGVHVILSNSSAPIVRELYGRREFKIKEVQMARSINSVGTGRSEIKELLIY